MEKLNAQEPAAQQDQRTVPQGAAGAVRVGRAKVRRREPDVLACRDPDDPANTCYACCGAVRVAYRCCKVETVAGWKERGRQGAFDPFGVLWQHGRRGASLENPHPTLGLLKHVGLPR